MMKASECYINRRVYVSRYSCYGQVVDTRDFMRLVQLDGCNEAYWLHPVSLRETSLALPLNCS
jgi:hypothetical protein